MDIVLAGRLYVVLNMDETSINTVQDSGVGLMCARRVTRRAAPLRPPDMPDRSNVKTSLLALVCDSPALQPYLPQIVLAKYTKTAAPPQWILDACAATGEPLEYWHGSGGWANTATIKAWATRVRSVIHSFNREAWILLVWDCATTHLNLDVVRHLRLLGILVVVIPAKLTWLLQTLDVHVFRELKERMRAQLTFLRMSSEAGNLSVGSWISCCGAAVRDVLVNRDWAENFDHMGLGEFVEDLHGRVRRAVPPAAVHPALPTRAQFARMVNRGADGENLRRLHATIVGHFLQVHRLPRDTPPRCGAVVPLQPDVPPALKRPRRDVAEEAQWEELLDEHFRRTASELQAHPHGRGPAVQRTLPPRVVE